MPDLTPSQLQTLWAEESDEAGITLFTFSDPHNVPSPAWTFRLCDNSQDVVSNGETFLGIYLDVVYPDQEVGTHPRFEVSLPGPSDDVARMLAPVTLVPKFKVQFIFLSDPDNIVQEYNDVELKSCEGDALTIKFSLAYEDLSEMPFPSERYSLPNFPGGFA